MKKRSLIIAAFVVIMASASFSYSASANEGRGRSAVRSGGRQSGEHAAQPSVVGTVVSVSSTVITVKAKNDVVYTVNAANAKIVNGFGNNASSTLSLADVKVGDMIWVTGTVSSTGVEATVIRDGFKKEKHDDDKPRMVTTSPVVVGTVKAVSGNVFTVEVAPLRGYGWSTTSSTASTYTVTVSSSTEFKKYKSNTLTIADVAVGQMVIVKGVVDNTAKTVSASVVIITPNFRYNNHDDKDDDHGVRSMGSKIQKLQKFVKKSGKNK